VGISGIGEMQSTLRRARRLAALHLLPCGKLCVDGGRVLRSEPPFSHFYYDQESDKPEDPDQTTGIRAGLNYSVNIVQRDVESEQYAAMQSERPVRGIPLCIHCFSWENIQNETGEVVYGVPSPAS
jgi:hypothetical protein